MALWQYKFRIIPSPSRMFGSEDNSDKPLGERSVDEETLWNQARISVDVFDSIKTVLPKADSWNDTHLIYGDLETTCLELGNKNGVIEYASVRVDFRTDFMEVLKALIPVLESNELTLLDENFDLVPLDTAHIRDIVLSAPKVTKYKLLAS